VTDRQTDRQNDRQWAKELKKFVKKEKIKRRTDELSCGSLSVVSRQDAVHCVPACCQLHCRRQPTATPRVLGQWTGLQSSRHRVPTARQRTATAETQCATVIRYVSVTLYVSVTRYVSVTQYATVTRYEYHMIRHCHRTEFWLVRTFVAVNFCADHAHRTVTYVTVCRQRWHSLAATRCSRST